MEDAYDNDFSKIALAVTSAQLAKSASVKEFGVGEDLTINFFGWVWDDLAIVCQMTKEAMKIDPKERAEICAELCLVLRKYWGVSAISMVAEGYCSFDSAETKGIELSKAFLDAKKPVKECITVTHASIGNSEEKPTEEPELAMVAIPYSYKLGREVIWDKMLIYPQGPKDNLRNNLYPKLLTKALKNKYVDDLPEESYDELRKLIMKNGFNIQEFS